MSTETPTPQKPSFGDRLAKFFINLVRAVVLLIFLVIVAGAIGVGLYYGVPWLYDKYVQPVEEHSVRLNAIETQQAQVVLQLTQEANAYDDRLATLEAQSATNTATLTALRTQLEEAITALQTSLDDTTTDVTASLERLDAVETTLDEINATLAEVETTTNQNSQSIQNLSATAEVQAQSIASLQYDLQLTKAMELLTRGQLFLSQANTGLAMQNIQAARDLLSTLKASDKIIDHLDLALSSLVDAPLAADADLEAAWQLLVIDLSESPSVSSSEATLSSPTPTETMRPTLTPTPTSAASSTPTQSTNPGLVTTPTSTPEAYP
jgi:uncharacterized coiled-coil protein SlyX